jgi:hypothetical protein
VFKVVQRSLAPSPSVVIEEHRRVDRRFAEALPSVSRRARGLGQTFRISQDSILEKLYLVRDIGHRAEDFNRGFDDRIQIESGMFNRDPLKRGIRRQMWSLTARLVPGQR